MTCKFRNGCRGIKKGTREIAAQIWNNMGSDECFYCNGNQSVDNKSSIIIEKFHLPTKYSNKFMESFSIDKSKYTCHVKKDCVNRHKIALFTILRIIEIGNIIMDKYVELCVLYCIPISQFISVTMTSIPCNLYSDSSARMSVCLTMKKLYTSIIISG